MYIACLPMTRNIHTFIVNCIRMQAYAFYIKIHVWVARTKISQWSVSVWSMNQRVLESEAITMM